MWSISITDYFLTPVISSIYKMVHLPFTSMVRIYWCYGLSMDGLIIYIPVHKFLDGGSVVAQLHWLNAGLNGWLMAGLMDGLMNRLIWWKDELMYWWIDRFIVSFLSYSFIGPSMYPISWFSYWYYGIMISSDTNNNH